MKGTEIAVIGLAARVPGSRNAEEYWCNLRDGAEAVKFFGDAELLAAGESLERLSDPAYVKAQAGLEGIDQFDAGFFGFSPQDAATMDPQHRILLEIAWEALENAAHSPETFPGSIGVFATCGMNSYMMHHLLRNRRIMDTVGEWLVRHTGNDMNFLATRVSYEMNLKGPSMNVQTACSSALVAIHQAAQSLLAGECDMALAGGCTLHSLESRGYLYRPGEILSPDGHCRPFDERAGGTLFGNGAGMVVLRRLDDAIAGGDAIRAVILGSAINNDGSAKVGYLAPSVEGQSQAIAEALAASGVHPETISYVEAHGTGTALGDPIEVAALTQAYRRHTRGKGFCALGSVKSNIGHLGEAAGAAGFIKTVLSLEHRQLPPTLHFEQPNPRLDLENSPFVVHSKLREWSSPKGPRRAGVTALGAGGTNCHVILEEAPARSASGPSRSHQLLTLSAKTPAALEEASKNLARHLREHPETNLADAAFTLNLGRKAFPLRRAVVGANREQAIAALEAAMPEAKDSSGEPGVAFLFPGQGSQYAGMGAGLYANETVFRQHVDECAALLKPELGLDLREAMFGSGENITNTALAQPALFTIESALAKLWMSWGVEPQAMLGHSIGEYVAAHLAGVFSLEDALALVAVRGRLMQQMPGGAMLSVQLSAAEAERYMNGHGTSGRLSLAAANAPALSVVAGSHERIAEFQAVLDREGVAYRPLHTSHAFHSAMMDPILAPFRDRVRRTSRQAPSLPFVSNVTGAWIRADEAVDPEYWVQHLRKPVRFSEGISTLLENPQQILLEAGPGRTLTTLAREQAGDQTVAVPSMRRAAEAADDLAFLLKACGQMWSQGAQIDWRAFWRGEQRQRLALPTYAFQRQRYWIQPDAPGQAESVTAPSRPSSGRRDDIADWFQQAVWKPSPPPEQRTTPVNGWLVFADETGVAARLTERLKRAPVAPSRLEIATPGEIDSLAWKPVERSKPGPGEVEIEVRATALNFADVLKATGAFADAPFGMECAGVIAAVGSGVTEWKCGDEVVAIGPGSHATRVIRGARFVARKPAGLSFEEAVTAPAAYMTAWYALHHVGGLKRGEKILIHAAAGGVGLAAVAIAQAAGAEVIATAGTVGKRAYLQTLGVRRGYSSRTLDFASEIDVVDVVLNSLTGEFIPKSLGLLAQGGRFLEIGKREILTPDQAPSGIHYTAIDLFRMLHDRPDEYAKLFAEVMDKLSSGEWKPLPLRAFPMEDARAAFDYMLRGRHTGKVVLTVKESAPEIFTVRAGDAFHKLGEREFTVCPAQEGDYRALCESLGDAVSRIGGVAHLWNITGNITGNSTANQGRWEESFDRGFVSVSNIAKALDRARQSEPLDLFVVSNGMHNVAGETALDCGKALLAGPCRVIPREFDGMRCRSIDLEQAPRIAHADGSWRQRRFADQLAAELLSEAPERTVAYRGSQRWVEEYQSAQVTPSGGAGLRERGVYLITGGLGGLGLALAGHLARSVHARLILTGRKFPDAATLETIRQMEAAGGQVLIARADVTDARQMRKAVGEARAAFGEIHGVFHAAGVLDDGLIQLQSREAALAVIRPKVQGALVLEEVFANQPLDFLALFSSVSSALGLEGQSAYTSANAFLDAFAQKLSRSGSIRAVSLGWGPWREIGMAARASGEKTFRYSLRREEDWVVGEHVIRGSDAILPGTGYLDFIASAFSAPAIEIGNVVFHAPCVIAPAARKDLSVMLKSDSTLEIRGDGVHVTANARAVEEERPAAVDLASILTRCNLREEILNGHLKQSFMDFGPRWGNVESIRYGANEALLTLVLPREFAADVETHRLHPAMLDMATGGAQALIPGFGRGEEFYVPFSYGRLRLWGSLPTRVFSHVRGKGPATFDVTLMDETGAVVCDICDFVMRPFDRAKIGEGASLEARFDPGIPPRQGLAALVRVLDSDAPAQVFVSPVDLREWIGKVDAAARPVASRHKAGTANHASFEQRLTAMWCEILGVGKIGPDDDFFELGGHSLLLVRLVNRIEKEFHAAVPLSYLFQSATVGRIAAYLHETLKEEAGSAKPLQFFVPFNDRGSGTPFYCVHSMGGDTHYRHLAKLLGPQQNFYGIQIPSELRTLEFTSSVEGMAARYVEELLKFQPEGPYLLGGRSAGACIALEMAQQLRAAGRDVSLLVSIDGAPLTVLGTTRRSSPRYLWKVLRNLPLWFADELLPGFSAAALVKRLQRRLARLNGPKRGSEKERVRNYLGDGEFSERALALMESFYGAVMRYVPQPYDGRVLLFQATEPLYDLQEVDQAWKRIAGRLEIVRVRGTHSSVVNEPCVGPMAGQLKARLEEFRSALE